MSFNFNGEKIKAVLAKGFSTILIGGLVLTIGCSKEGSSQSEPTKSAKVIEQPQEQPVVEEDSNDLREIDPQLLGTTREEAKKMAQQYNGPLDKELAFEYFDSQYIIAVTSYISKNMSFSDSQFTNPERADAYGSVGVLAEMDLRTDGKFSDFWYQLMPSDAMETRFKEEIATPIEAIYQEGNFDAILSDLEANQVQSDDHINNLKISIVNQVIRNHANKTQEQQETIKVMYEKLYDQYFEGILVSTTQPTTQIRAV